MGKKENGDGIKPRKDIAREDPAEVDCVKNLIYDNSKEQADGAWYLDIDASDDFFIHDDRPKVHIGAGSYYVTVVMWFHLVAATCQDANRSTKLLTIFVLFTQGCSWEQNAHRT